MKGFLSTVTFFFLNSMFFIKQPCKAIIDKVHTIAVFLENIHEGN